MQMETFFAPTEHQPGPFAYKDLFASASDDVSMLEQVGNAVCFRAKSSSTGFDLYRTNGTNAGASKVQGITGGLVRGRKHYFFVRGLKE